MRPTSSPGSSARALAARGVAWGGVESAAVALAGLLITPLLVGRFGLDGLGLWAACWSVAHTAGLFDFGVGSSYARFTARAIARRDLAGLNGIIAAGSGLHLGLSALLAAAFTLAWPAVARSIAAREALREEAPVLVGCALAAVLLRLTLSAYRGVVAGAQRLDLLGRIGAGVALLEGAGALTVILLGGGLATLGINSLAAAALACGLEASAAHRLCPGLRLRPFRARRPDWGEILSFGLKLQATRAAEIVMRHAPRLILAAGPGLAAAGAYDLGARVAGALQVAGALPLPVIQPLASRLEALGDGARLRSLLVHSTRYVTLLVAPLVVIVLVDAPGILLAWTGRPAPTGSADSARLLSLAVCLALLVSPLRLSLRGVGRAGLEAAASSCAAALTLVLAAALSGPLGETGVALGCLAATGAASAIVALGARRVRPAMVDRDLLRSLRGPALAALGSLAVGWTFSVSAGAFAGAAAAGRGAALAHLCTLAALMLAAFVSVGVVSGAIRREDLELLRASAPATARGAGGATA
ncbi:MAG: lipopolysaccharide biosynthesis protein [Acidobacteriota bacterium]